MSLNNPIHPGEILLEEFIEPFGLTQHALAVHIAIPPRRINEIVHGKRSITTDTALRLAKAFGTTPEFWVNLQTHYDINTAKDALSPVLDSINPIAVYHNKNGTSFNIKTGAIFGTKTHFGHRELYVYLRVRPHRGVLATLP